MPEFAQFVAITEADSAFTLPDSATGSTDRHFENIDLADVNRDRTAVVMFKVTARGQIKLRMRFNTGNEHFVDFGFQSPTSESTPRSWHEILPGRDLRAADNQLIVSVSGPGSVVVSDVVILYHART